MGQADATPAHSGTPPPPVRAPCSALPLLTGDSPWCLLLLLLLLLLPLPHLSLGPAPCSGALAGGDPKSADRERSQSGRGGLKPVQSLAELQTAAEGQGQADQVPRPESGGSGTAGGGGGTGGRRGRHSRTPSADDVALLQQQLQQQPLQPPPKGTPGRGGGALSRLHNATSLFNDFFSHGRGSGAQRQQQDAQQQQQQSQGPPAPPPLPPPLTREQIFGRVLTTLSEPELLELEHDLDRQARRLLEAIHIDKFNSDAIKVVVLENAVVQRLALGWNQQTLAALPDGKRDRPASEIARFLIRHLHTYKDGPLQSHQEHSHERKEKPMPAPSIPRSVSSLFLFFRQLHLLALGIASILFSLGTGVSLSSGSSRSWTRRCTPCWSS